MDISAHISLRRLTIEEILASDHIENADLSRLDLSGLDLSNKSFTNVKFEETNLQNADLSNSVFTLAFFTRADCKKAKFINAKLNQVQAFVCDFKTSDFTNSELSIVKLSNSELYKATFLGSKLFKVYFDACDSISEKSDDGKVYFDQVEATSCTFSNSLEGFSCKGAKLQSCKLSGVFTNANFSNSILTDVIGYQASFELGIFDSAEILDSEFELADFTDVRFQKTIIKKTSFIGANVGGAILNEADIEQCDLRAASYRSKGTKTSKRTIFPDNFKEKEVMLDESSFTPSDFEDSKRIQLEKYYRLNASLKYNLERERLFDELVQADNVNDAFKILDVSFRLPSNVVRDINTFLKIISLPLDEDIAEYIKLHEVASDEKGIALEAIKLLNFMEKSEIRDAMNMIISLLMIDTASMYNQIVSYKVSIPEFILSLKEAIKTNAKEDMEILLNDFSTGDWRGELDKVLLEIKENYSEIALKCHPDRTTSERKRKKFILANSAMQLLRSIGLDPFLVKNEKSFSTRQLKVDPYAHLRPLALPEKIDWEK